MRRLRENIRRKRPDKWRNKSWVLHHDNVPAHASLVVRQFLASTKTTVIPQPPYSPDLAPCDYFLFPKMKLKLKGRRFDSIEEIQTESQDVMKTLTQNDFQQCFRSWKSKGTTSKGMEANKNFGKWLSCGIQISGTFG
jgi:transposase